VFETLLYILIVGFTFSWEECMLKVFENKVLRKIFGSEVKEVTGDWETALCVAPGFVLFTK
jgi:hypothetical protein